MSRRDLNSHLSTRPEDLDWKPMAEGVRYASVLKDRERDYSVIFLEFEPGARAVRHVHHGGEQYWMIRGSIEDANGTFEAGTFVNMPPGSVHEPWSPDGALILVTWFGKLEAYEE